MNRKKIIYSAMIFIFTIPGIVYSGSISRRPISSTSSFLRSKAIKPISLTHSLKQTPTWGINLESKMRTSTLATGISPTIATPTFPIATSLGNISQSSTISMPQTHTLQSNYWLNPEISPENITLLANSPTIINEIKSMYDQNPIWLPFQLQALNELKMKSMISQWNSNQPLNDRLRNITFTLNFYKSKFQEIQTILTNKMQDASEDEKEKIKEDIERINKYLKILELEQEMVNERARQEKMINETRFGRHMRSAALTGIALGGVAIGLDLAKEKFIEKQEKVRQAAQEAKKAEEELSKLTDKSY